MHREMTIHAFGLDSATKLPVIILKDLVSEQQVPLWLKEGDLVVIATDLVGRELTREKDSSDLISTLLKSLELSPDRIILDDREDGSYGARLLLERREDQIVIPLAVQEAILMALRFSLPVMVASTLVARLTLPRGISDQEASPEGRYDGLLEKLDPADMGKFPM